MGAVRARGRSTSHCLLGQASCAVKKLEGHLCRCALVAPGIYDAWLGVRLDDPVCCAFSRRRTYSQTHVLRVSPCTVIRRALHKVCTPFTADMRLVNCSVFYVVMLDSRRPMHPRPGVAP